MRAKQFRIKPDACHPFREKPSILAGRHALAVTLSAREQRFAWLLTGGSEVVIDRLAGLIRELELDRLSRLLLPHHCAIDCIAIRSNILDLQGDDVATTKLAINGKVEHRQVAGSSLDQQSGSDRPNVLWSQWRFGPN